MITRTLKISAAVALSAALIYQSSTTYNRISPIPTNRITSSSTISKALVESKAAKIVNPNQHIPIHDTRYTTIRVNENLSDEEILAAFIQGFFGGRVFGPERGLLRLAGIDITQLNRIRDIPVSSHIWSTAQLPLQTIPQPHSLLFGVFRVVDSHLEARAAQKVSQQSHSYIDFVFGSDTGPIAGVHRFSVHRNGASRLLDEQTVDGKVNVMIEFAHNGCNTKEDKPLGPQIIQTFHLWYAMLLFREGMAGVLDVDKAAGAKKAS